MKPSKYPLEKEYQVLTVRDFLLSFFEPFAYAGLISTRGHLRQAYRQLIKQRKLDRERLSQLVYRLKQRQLVREYFRGKEKYIELTNEGRKKLLRLLVADEFSKFMPLKKGQSWDKKWYMVAFDIPEKYRDGRDILRSTLKRLGFAALQKSLFVSPFDHRAEIEVVKDIYHIKPYVISIMADDIEGAAHLIHHFTKTEILSVS